MPLYIASDHGGYQLKKTIIRFVENQLEQKITDLGPTDYIETDDYPDYAIPLAQKVSENDQNYGILLCKNGVGVCIAANKIPGIRAGIGYNLMAAETMKTDDNTNILCLPAKLLSDEHAQAVVRKWLETKFSNEERHVRRLEKVAKLETR